MSRVHHAVRYRFDHKDRFLIWHSEGTDTGVIPALHAGEFIAGEGL